jgi:ribosome maturation factor RimP
MIPSLSLDRQKLDGVLDPILRAHGAEVVDVELKSEAQGWVLRVFVEKLGSSERKASTLDAAVNLELCSNVARELSPALDVADVVPHRYHLEVSSPGLERSLKKLSDFERFNGEIAKFKFALPVRSHKTLKAVVKGVQGDAVILAAPDAASAEEFVVQLTNIVSAHLVYEFRASPKPGKSKKSR